MPEPSVSSTAIYQLRVVLCGVNPLTAKGLPERVGEGEDQYELRPGVLKDLERIKWYLWHGNVFQALNELQSLEMDLDAAAFESKDENAQKLLKGVEDLHTYVERNQEFVPNYGERYRNGEKIASGFVESAANQVVSKRMVKKQQMGWSQRGAHLLLQIRIRVLDQEWETTFRRWYPDFRPHGKPRKRRDPLDSPALVRDRTADSLVTSHGVGVQIRKDRFLGRLKRWYRELQKLLVSCARSNTHSECKMQTSSAPEGSESLLVALWPGRVGASQWWTSMRRSWKPDAGMGSK